MTSPQPSVVAQTLNLSNAEARIADRVGSPRSPLWGDTRTEPVAHIYKITNTVSGKCYVGETTCKDPEERWRRHKAKIRRGLGCPALRDAVNKYGVDKFKFEVIRECTLDERFDIECEYINKYNTVVPNGYNILLGGGEGRPTGLKHKPESIEKIKTSLKKRGQGIGIKIGVRTTGCSGLAYVLEYVDEVQPGDDVVVQEGFSIIVNKKDQPYLKDMQIDYVRQGLNEGFEFINPNEKDRCGCGESFRI
jgi:iron-sulfur cluster assembly protein